MDLHFRLLANTTDRLRSMARFEPTTETHLFPDVQKVGGELTRNHKLAVKSVEQQTIVKACRPGCTLQWAKGFGGLEHAHAYEGREEEEYARS